MAAVVVYDRSKSKSSIYSLCQRLKLCVVINPRCGLQAQRKIFCLFIYFPIRPPLYLRIINWLLCDGAVNMKMNK